MHVNVACKTTPGRIRTSNEDNVYLDGVWLEDGKQKGHPRTSEGRPFHTYAVCDGMGGESFGEIASLLAVQTLAEWDGPDLTDRFREYIDAANRRICDEASRRLVNRMGAVIAILRLSEGRAAICDLGDCRVYQYDDRGLRQLSEDHRTDLPGIGEGMLTQNLGIPEDEFVLEPHIIRDIQIDRETLFLLCSDGLTDMVTDQMLEENLREKAGETPAAIAGELLMAAARQGGRDNITALVVQVTP